MLLTGETAGEREKRQCDRCGRIQFVPIGNRLHPGRCKSWPHKHEIGHWLAFILEACFIRKEDYMRLKAKLGLAPKCGCDKREAALNTWGDRVRGWLKKKPDHDQEARP